MLGRVLGVISGPRFLLVWTLLACAGCSSTKVITDPIIGPGHTVTNVFKKQAYLPAELRRVALLPLTAEHSEPGSISGLQTLEPILRTELGKAGRFEIVNISPADLQKWTGKERWDSQQTLPPDLLKKIEENTGADGVIFVRLSRYHAYPPMVIGWRMALASNDGDLLWSVDEIFDAAEEGISNSARRYDRGHVRNNPVLEDSRSILLSPRKFGQYTLAALIQTLPFR